ncbi:MAG: hypothetical protein H3C36_15740, partial [Chitinophagaceae bacterium]|nr:hypothetical protein [Chitinophagaceae bacterium]
SYNLLPKDETSAPEAAYSPLTIIASAEKHKSQFIVSGSVIDMSMVYPEQYFNQSLPGKALASVKAGFGKLFGKEQVDHRLRNMSFRMTLYDGASGAIVFDKVYTEKGTWDAEYREAVGFGSPRFWHTGYGKAVDSLMNSAVVDLGKKLQCQPFMINAEYLPDDGSVYIPAGVDQGIKVGDSLALYFRKNLRGATHNKATSEKDVMPFSLEDIGVSLSIVQAYPSYSIAKPSAELHSGLRYVAVSW